MTYKKLTKGDLNFLRMINTDFNYLSMDMSESGNSKATEISFSKNRPIWSKEDKYFINDQFEVHDHKMTSILPGLFINFMNKPFCININNCITIADMLNN